MLDPRTSRLARLARRIAQLGRRHAFDARMDEEMRQHIECEAIERMARGMSAEDAWRTAARDFGGIERHKEEARDVRGVRLIDDAARDASYALRVLRRNRGFTAAVVLTFALGIGCTSAIFSLVNGILLRPLPYEQPGGLVALWERNEARKGGTNVVSVPTFEAWRDRARSFSGVAALVPDPLTLDGAPAERIKGVQVSPGYFAMLGVHPAMGRDFTAADAENDVRAVVILSDAIWRTRYGSDRSIVGHTISIDGSPVTVIGVMSRAFDPPRFGWIGDQPLWLPFSATEDNRKWGRFLHVVARLRPGITVEQAGGELSALSAHLAEERPDNKGWSASAISLDETITDEVRRPLVVLLAAVALLLMMSAVNVASLITTFTRRRQHELVLRRAIGATSSRLMRQQVMQSALLGAGGTIGGLGLAFLGARMLVVLAPSSVPRVAEVGVDMRVVVFATLVALVTTLAVGLVAARRQRFGAPALQRRSI